MTRIPLDPRLEPGRLAEVAPSAIFVTGALILVGVAFLLLASWSLARSGAVGPGDAPPEDDDPDTGGGGPHRDPPRDGPPDTGGGIPRADARPAAVRLREESRRGDARRNAPRRRVAEPARRTTPSRHAGAS